MYRFILRSLVVILEGEHKLGMNHLDGNLYYDEKETTHIVYIWSYLNKEMV